MCARLASPGKSRPKALAPRDLIALCIGSALAAVGGADHDGRSMSPSAKATPSLPHARDEMRHPSWRPPRLGATRTQVPAVASPGGIAVGRVTPGGGCFATPRCQWNCTLMRPSRSVDGSPLWPTTMAGFGCHARWACCAPCMRTGNAGRVAR